MSSSMHLHGTSAIITGGAVRIGREIGRQLANSGVNICVHYGNSESEAKTAVEEFEGFGVKATMVSADLSEPFPAAEKIFQHAKREFGNVSILINSAAIFESGTLQSTDEGNWDRHFDINLKTPFALTQAFAKQLGDQTGHVINIVDWRGARPVPGQLAYSIAKAGLVAQTKILAQELGPRIRVNGVAPGAILPAPGESATDFAEKSALNPLNTTGGPEDISNAVLYLLTSNFVTGEILCVTGGQQL